MAAEPTIRKFPTEIFGHPYTEHGEAAKIDLAEQACPFLSATCKKPRKSEPEVKVGVCSVGYKGNFLESYRPVVICPHRFLQDNEVFRAIQDLYFPGFGGELSWVSEVKIGGSGSVDYVAVKLDDASNAIEEFLCVEFQAAGTTGTPWKAVQEFKASRSFSANSYEYGINWANEFSKTMMQQVYKKGRVIDSWGKKIVFVIQEVAIEYLHSAVDTSELRKARDNDPIHFVAFEMAWSEAGKWVLQHKDSYSTTLNGVNRILGGAGYDALPTEEDFRRSIYSKG